MTPEELAVRLRDAPGEVAVMMARETRRVAADIEREAKLAVTGRVLRVRSGRLRASIRASVRQEGRDLLLTASAGGRGLGSGTVRYAAIHEHGGIVRPVRARMLAIPLPGARTAAGVSRYASPLRQTAAGELRLAVSRAGSLGLRSTRDGRWLFTLTREARIPARPYLGPAVREGHARLLRRLVTGMRAVLRGGDHG